MAYKTREELVLAALQEIRAASAGETPTTEDSDVVDGYVEPMLDGLAEQGVIGGIDPSTIRGSAFPWLVILLAQFVIAKFGGSIDAGAIQLAKSELRPLGMSGPTYAPLKVDYF